MKPSRLFPVLSALWLGIASPLLLAVDEPVSSVETETDSQTTEDQAADFFASLTPQHGQISLPGKFATVMLPERFIYLNSKDTERLLTEGWGNPDGSGTLGMILPADVHPMSAEGWGIILTYDGDGYVSDEDAAEIDYSDLLDEMQDATKDENEARQQGGFGNIELVGWALPPSYDSASHKMIWAKELKFAGSPANTLNYNIRVLGREGVLVMNAVAGMDQLSMIRTEAPALVRATEFVAGKRYEDFNADTDHKAEYGLAALVAGGAAAKMGLFGKIGALLLAFKKLIFAGLIGLGVLISKLMGRKKSAE